MLQQELEVLKVGRVKKKTHNFFLFTTYSTVICVLFVYYLLIIFLFDSKLLLLKLSKLQSCFHRRKIGQETFRTNTSTWHANTSTSRPPQPSRLKNSTSSSLTPSNPSSRSESCPTETGLFTEIAKSVVTFHSQNETLQAWNAILFFFLPGAARSIAPWMAMFFVQLWDLITKNYCSLWMSIIYVCQFL